MRFDFATATKIIFGAGTLKDAGSILPTFGKCAFVVVGRDAGRAKPLLEMLDAQDIVYTVFESDGEPNIQDARNGTNLGREANTQFVIALGGGSVLDLGKAIAALLTNEGDPLDYLEVIGKGKPLQNQPLPLVAIPTTAGTGSEVTSNAVLASPEHRVKVSLRSPSMLARLALVDSTLTYTTPPEVTAQSGLDALTQVIEPFVSNKANPLTDSICREGIRRAGRSLQRAYEQGGDVGAREAMALVSLFGGLALSNARLGAVHGFAGPMGGMYDAPHGAICARLLPFVMEANIRALREHEPDSPITTRYDEIAQLLTGNDRARADDGVQFVHDLCTALHIRPLSTFGLSASEFPALIEKAGVASSMQGNPVKLTVEEMESVLAKAL
jgi:alcohol dehydrogenase class IV